MADVAESLRLEELTELHSAAKAPPVQIAGVLINAWTFEDVVKAILAKARDVAEPAFVITPNAYHVVLYQSDALLRGIYRRAFLVVPDGVSLLWAAKLLGFKLRGRVNGTDLFEALCAEAAERNLRVFLLGGRKGAAEAAATQLVARHRALCICGTYCPPLGFEQDPAEVERTALAVQSASPDLLFVGLGAPKQEYWMFFHARRIGVPVSIGVGVSFEFIGGLVPRAPRWMQRAGLEWLFRLGSEPGRLWKRYLFGNLHFCALIIGQYLSQRMVARLRQDALG
jgi:N-acetylglucosaminyldiphosphoundecaprenol N-acetyl-beta-D-mannosaminyltransferase